MENLELMGKCAERCMNVGGGIQRFMKLNLVGWSACGVKMQKHLNSHKNIAQVQIHMWGTGTCVSSP